MIVALLRKLLQYPDARGVDLDSSAATALHRRMLRDKPFLRQLYTMFYNDFAAVAHRAPVNGLRLELGAGAGFLPEVIPGTRTLDLRPGARVDLRGSALQLPFRDGSVSCLFMLDVLHHLPDAGTFFAEAQRVLVPDGRIVLIDPYNSTLSRQIYKRLHHEPFDEQAPDWQIGPGGPMTSANPALPWIIFVRDRARFESQFPELELVDIKRHTILLYLLSGGLSVRAMAPSSMFEPLRRIEDAVLPFAADHLATMMTVELRKRANSLARTDAARVFRSVGGER